MLAFLCGRCFLFHEKPLSDERKPVKSVSDPEVGQWKKTGSSSARPGGNRAGDAANEIKTGGRYVVSFWPNARLP